ncbi:MAG: site-specific integrase [Nitrososphaeraceae archaeon]
MEALQHEKKPDEDEVYFNFINSLKSEITKETYKLNIKLFMDYCNVIKYSDLLIITEPQKQIIKYLIWLREKGLSSNSISTRLNAIYHFYEMNDVTLNRKKINMFKGQFARRVIDRAYTHYEISKVLTISDLRMKILFSIGMKL